MEIKRVTGSSSVPVETEAKEVKQQPKAQHGVGATTDSFETSAQHANFPFDEVRSSRQTDQVADPHSGKTAVTSRAAATENSLLQELQQRQFVYGNFVKNPALQIPSGLVDIKPEILSPGTVVLTNLSQVTGKSVAELQALFQKHGLDPANMPGVQDPKLTALLNDPAFDSSLNDLKANVSSTYQNLQNKINDATSAAHSINSSNLASDTSVYDNLDTTPFKFLNDASKRTDSYSKAYDQAQEGVADRCATLLSAMYPGKELESGLTTGTGQIRFDGKPFYVCPEGFTGKIQLSASTPPSWPEVQKVTWYYDAEGDAAVSPPNWMYADNYPRKAYDD